MRKQSLVDPLQFCSLFGSVNRIAFVGNGSGILGTHSGAIIDRADIVVRFNLCRTFSFEADVGREMHVYVTNGLDREIREPLEDRCNIDSLVAGIAIIPLEQLTLELNPAEGYHLPRTDVPFLISLATLSRLDYLAAKTGIAISKWTTGTYAIYLLTMLLKPREILLSGFDLFTGEQKTVHYFDQLGKGRKRATQNHDVRSEVRIWQLMLEQLPCYVYATSDVAAAMPEVYNFLEAA